MATEMVVKVWIAPGCIVCDACETTCPEVFQVTEDSCIIRPEALDAEFTKPLTQSIIEAAEECPVEVIKFETVAVEGGVPSAGAAVPAVETPAEPAVAAAPAEPAAAAAKAPAERAAAVAEQPRPAAAVDPAIQALLKATTARGGKAGIERGSVESPPAVKALRSRTFAELPPDARYTRVLQAARTEKTLAATPVSRRAVISAAGIGWLSFGASAALSGAILQRFMMPNVLEEPDPRVRTAPLAQFAQMAIGEVNEDFKPQGIWIVRLEGEITALSIVCTHLGCIPNWMPGERKFKCPCHGSGFIASGIHVEGPAPRPLERFRIAVEDGIVVVDRSRKFQHEKGEWSNPESFITV